MPNPIILAEEYNYEDIFSSPLLLPPSYIKIFSSAPCSQTPSIHVLPSTREIEFHSITGYTSEKLNTASSS
jgi:hypothetical protein